MKTKYTCVAIVHLLMLLFVNSSLGGSYNMGRFDATSDQSSWLASRKHMRSRSGVLQSIGKIWPKPQTQTPNSDVFLSIVKDNFSIELDTFSAACDIVQQAVKRYSDRFFTGTSPAGGQVNDFKNDIMYGGQIPKLEIVMTNKDGCEKYPYQDMNEQYVIKVDTPDEPLRARVISVSVWGILRGLESFSHLLYASSAKDGILYINRTEILDFPRFTFRGILLDSSRHFLSKNVILQNLDLMEMNKFNVFHWHLSDDQAFPYVSKKFPNLSLKGAYDPKTHVYSQDDIAEILEAARLRGIRVIPEFDTPGHTYSWELGQPGLLTKCTTGAQSFGPMNPTKPEVFTFLSQFFEEIFQVFPDSHLHIGGDEVDKQCWNSNPEVQDFMLKNNITNLESYFIETLLKTLDTLGLNKTYIVWEEVFNDGDKIKPDTIVDVWMGNWQTTVNMTTSKGYKTVVAAPWYLNYISYGPDWSKYYLADPQDFGGSSQQQALVIGGEACMWGEYVNSINLLPRLWPRASAVAERLWSSMETRNVNEAAARISEQECRMLFRGYPVQPVIGPSFCKIDWSKKFLGL